MRIKMKVTTENFEDFIRGSFDYDKEKKKHTGIYIRSEHMDVGGGRIKKEEIDHLSEYDNIETVSISGLTQDTFEYFIEKYGREIRAIKFFKNKMVEDWSLLGTLPNLEFIYWFHNQRIDKMWDMSGNVNLKGICISDFSRLKKLDGVEKAPALEWFSMRDAVWNTSVAESYSCFKNTKVKYLEFWAKKILDEDISFIMDMPELEYFECAANMFSTEKFAYIMANCPDVRGNALNMFIEDTMYNKETQKFDIPALRLTGKGKRVFRKTDEKRRCKLEKEFMDMLEVYRGKSYEEFFC